jgi:hypothetical protein
MDLHVHFARFDALEGDGIDMGNGHGRDGRESMRMQPNAERSQRLPCQTPVKRLYLKAEDSGNEF